MRKRLTALAACACLAASPAVAAAGWKPVEQVKTYAVHGETGAALYKSIGERGPEIGNGMRTIAHTSFKLTWTRKYEVQNGACVLTVARPKLIITYVVPKPANKLPPAVQAQWDKFSSGVLAHEKVHGEHIKEMVRDIEAATLGFSVPDDAACKKIREQMTVRLGALSQTQRQRGRDFDRMEMSEGGNIHQLILGLVNNR